MYEVCQKSNETSNTASDLATLRCSLVTEFLTSKCIPVIPQHPHSPDLSPVTFSFLLNLKMPMKDVVSGLQNTSKECNGRAEYHTG